MKLFCWWRSDPEPLERAKRLEQEAKVQLSQARQTSRWVDRTLEANGFAEALMTIMRGGT